VLERLLCPTNEKEKAEMTRSIRSFVGLAVLVTAVAANAQFSHQARVTVPFSFTAAGTVSPPGDYRVDIDRSREMVMLSSENSKPVMFFTIAAWQQAEGRSYLRFHRYGEQWFLEQVAINGLAEDVPIAKRLKQVFTASNTVDGGPLSADIALH
jgi:hypothetical protein